MKKKNDLISRFSKKKITGAEFLKYIAGTVFVASFSAFSDPSGSNPPNAEAYGSFKITFDKQINTVSVENATNISPASILSSPIWTENNTTVGYTFEGDNTDTEYTITIGAAAQDIYGTNLDRNSNGIGGDPCSFTMHGTTVPF